MAIFEFDIFISIHDLSLFLFQFVGSKKLEIGTFYVFKNQHSNKPIDQLKIAGKVFKLIAVPRHTNDGSLKEIADSGLKILKRKEAPSGSRFGMSLINLGRFDGDEYEDFAVGAPGEDNGVGAIYVYRGSQSFWTKDNDKNGKKSYSYVIYLVHFCIK